MAFDIVNDCNSGPTNCSLSYDSKAKPLFGAFKCVVLGRTSICMTAVSKPVNFSENSIAFTGPVAYVLDLVYNFVKSALQCHGLPTFPIPQM